MPGSPVLKSTQNKALAQRSIAAIRLDHARNVLILIRFCLRFYFHVLFHICRQIAPNYEFRSPLNPSTFSEANSTFHRPTSSSFSSTSSSAKSKTMLLSSVSSSSSAAKSPASARLVTRLDLTLSSMALSPPPPVTGTSDRLLRQLRRRLSRNCAYCRLHLLRLSRRHLLHPHLVSLQN